MSSSDPLILLRTCIAASKPPQLTTATTPDDAPSQITDSLVDATHLYFSYPTPQCIPLTITTRFTSQTPNNVQVDLRSIWFAWLTHEVTPGEYLAQIQELDQRLPHGQKLRNLVFVERLELTTWLEGGTEESEYIKPSEDAPGTDGAAAKAANIAGGAGVPIQSGPGATTAQAGKGRQIDARLQTIYNGERIMVDHNSVLRGIKPTVSSTRLTDQY